MLEFWENIFKDEVEIWGTEPSDSAILVKNFFLSKGIKDILIPGIGYGRNAKIFLDNHIHVTGIEISSTAIKIAREKLKLAIKIYHGSVTQMPFDTKFYQGIFCYALLHLLEFEERAHFLQNCYNQLEDRGYMFFTIISKYDRMYGQGKLISKDQFQVSNGLPVFFYDSESIEKEFKEFGLIDHQLIEEPIKFKENEPALKCYLIKCQKN